MADEMKNRENRLRRVAARRGLVLRKTRRRDPGALDYGMYSLTALQGDTEICRSRSLDEIEEFLDGYDAKTALGS
jgi:hypothetical protein